jgi:hypothetical protein
LSAFAKIRTIPKAKRRSEQPARVSLQSKVGPMLSVLVDVRWMLVLTKSSILSFQADKYIMLSFHLLFHFYLFFFIFFFFLSLSKRNPHGGTGEETAEGRMRTLMKGRELP